MNLRLYALIALLGTQVLAFAAPSERNQRPVRPSKELIQKEKKAFLTKELSLTAKEADDLMIIINELDGKRFALWKSCYSMRRRMQSSGGGITDAEYEKYFNQVMDNRVQESLSVAITPSARRLFRCISLLNWSEPIEPLLASLCKDSIIKPLTS